MVRILEIQGPNCREKLHSPLPKAIHVCLKKKNPKEKASLHQRGRGPTTELSHFRYRNDTKPADGAVDPDPASEQNHMGPPSQYLTSLDSSGSVRSEFEAGHFDLAAPVT